VQSKPTNSDHLCCTDDETGKATSASAASTRGWIHAVVVQSLSRGRHLHNVISSQVDSVLCITVRRWAVLLVCHVLCFRLSLAYVSDVADVEIRR